MNQSISTKRDDYYKLNVENLQSVFPAIRPQRRRRIVFIPTTLNKLKKAKEINDLYYTSPIEEKVYEHLQKEQLSAERQLFVRENEATYCLDFAVFCKKGKIDIECDGEKWHSLKKNRIYDRKRNNTLSAQGWTVLRFSGDEINNNIESCIKQIKKTIGYLKGAT